MNYPKTKQLIRVLLNKEEDLDLSDLCYDRTNNKGKRVLVMKNTVDLMSIVEFLTNNYSDKNIIVKQKSMHATALQILLDVSGLSINIDSLTYKEVIPTLFHESVTRPDGAIFIPCGKIISWAKPQFYVAFGHVLHGIISGWRSSEGRSSVLLFIKGDFDDFK